MKKRIIALLIICTMLFTMIPTAFAIEQDPSINVALGKTVTASTQWSERYGCAKVVDGLIGEYDRWAPHDPTDDNPWICIDLEQSYYIDTVVINEYANAGNYRCTDFNLSVSEDNSNWSTVYSGKSIGKELTIPLDASKKIRYVKVHDLKSNDPNGDVSLHEIEVYKSSSFPQVTNSLTSVDADAYNSQKSTVDFTASENAHDFGSAIISANAGEVLAFDNVELTGAKSLMFVAAIAQGSTSKQIQVYIDDHTNAANLIGSLTTLATAKVNDYDFNEQYADITSAITGKHTVYFKFVEDTELELDFFKFTSYTGTETDAQHDARMEWWRDAKFGQFIHLGAYSYLGGYYNGQKPHPYSEWIMHFLKMPKEEYKEAAAEKFNPDQFDAEKIVSDAVAAGQKYLIITSRHHEGFSIYDTQIRNYKDYSLFSVGNYGNYNGVDPLLELSKECEKQGIVFGVYTTIMDWYDPSQVGFDYNSIADGYTKEEYKAQLKAQMKELVEKYNTKVFFFDGQWVNWWTTEDGKETYRYILSLDETCVINNRVGKRAVTDGDYGTPEQEIPTTGLDYDWESCMTMNDSWGYCIDDSNWKSPQWIVQSVLDIASKGGNLLLNVGPDGRGVVEQAPIDNMSVAGKWFEKFGDAVYGTRISCFTEKVAENIRVTTKPDEGKVYVSLLSDDPANEGYILLPALANDIISVKEMASGKAVPYLVTGGKLYMDISDTEKQDYATVYEITVNGEPIEAKKVDNSNIALGKTVTASTYWSATYAPGDVVDGLIGEYDRWAPRDELDDNPWITIDLAENYDIGKIVIYEYNPSSPRCVGVKVSVSNDNATWTEVYSGSAIGEKLDINLDEVKNARYVKVHDLASNNPSGDVSIYEIEIYQLNDTAEITLDMGSKDYVDSPYTLTGTYYKGTKVDLLVSGDGFNAVTVDAVVDESTNTWSAVIDDVSIKAGNISVLARLYDDGGNIVALENGTVHYAGYKNLAFGKTTEHSSQFVLSNGMQLGAHRLVDGILTGEYERWAPLDSDTDTWASIDLGSVQNVSSFTLFEWNSRAQSFKISVSEDNQNWTQVHSGTTIGNKLNITLDNVVKARYVKIHDLVGNGGNVSLYEMGVFGPDEIGSIEISKLPSKLEYHIFGEELDVSDGEITVTYTNGEHKILSMTKAQISGFESLVAGKNTLTVTFGDKQVEFDITVTDHEFTDSNDTACNICGYGHNVIYNWDSEYHWQECTDEDCLKVFDKSSHTFDNVYDNTCDECGYTFEFPLISELVDEHSLIDGKKAVILTNEQRLSDAQAGQSVVLTWCGKAYSFVKGENAFATLSEIAAKNLDNPHILVKNVTEPGNNFYLTFPACAFTQNYAANPVKKGELEDGSDWTFNEGTLDSQFNTSEDVDVIYSNVGLGRDSTNTVCAVSAGEYKFYGFTINYTFLDQAADVKVDVTLANSRFLTNNWGEASGSTVTTANNIFHITSKEDADEDSLVVKNVYITTKSGDMPGDMFLSNNHEHVTFEGIFVDIPRPTCVTADTRIIQSGTNTSFFIKDSCFKNYQLYNVRFRGNNTPAVAGQKSSVVIENNIFNESCFRKVYDGVIAYYPDALTKLTVNDNYIKVSEGCQIISSNDGGSTIEGAPLKLSVIGNYVDAVIAQRNDVSYRNYTDDSVVSGNFTKLFGTNSGIGIYFTGAPQLNSSTWLISADGTNTSGTIQQMTFNGETFDKVETITVEYDVELFNVKELIKTIGSLSVNGIEYNANIIEGYLDKDCLIPLNLEKVPVSATGSKLYIKIKSPDGLTVSDTVYEIDILKESEIIIGNSALGSVYNETVNETDYYWVTWRGQVNATGEYVGGSEAEHRVGTLYFSSTSNLNAMKEYVANALKEQTDINSIEQIISDANELFASGNTIKGYVMNKNKTLSWDVNTQSYGYRYNFNIHEDWYRGAVMYVVYLNEENKPEILFSDMVVQKSGAVI